MAKFVWRDTLTVVVEEMSWADALDCYRSVIGLQEALDYPALTDLMLKLAVLHSPARVILNGETYASGQVTVNVPDMEPFVLELPLQEEALYKLKHSLVTAWQEAALTENAFLGDWVKNALRPLLNAMQQTESSFDSGPSAPQTEPPEKD